MALRARLMATILTVSSAFAAGSCKHPESRTQDSDATQAVKICKDKDAKAKTVGQIFGLVLMGASASIPGMEAVAYLSRGVLGSASSAAYLLVPSLVGTCNVSAESLAQLKKDIDRRLGDVLDQLNTLSLEVVHNNLAFYDVSLSTAVSNLEVYRAQILDNDDTLDAYTTGLAAAYGAVAVSLNSIADAVETKTSITFMAAAYDLANAHAYFALVDHDKLLPKVLASSSKPSTKGQFVHNFDLMTEAYTRFLNALATRKKNSDMPYLHLTSVGGSQHGTWPPRMLDHGKNVRNPIDCPYPSAAKAKTGTAAIKFRDDHLTTLRYEYRTFGGTSGTGQIAPEKIEGFEVQLMTRPSDKKARHGYTAVSGTYCDLEAYDDNTKLGDAIAAAIEENPAATKNEALKTVNSAIDTARTMWETIDAEAMSKYAVYLRAALSADPRWAYAYDETAGTGVPSVETATQQISKLGSQAAAGGSPPAPATAPAAPVAAPH